MIRKTLAATKNATFSVQLPHAAMRGMPTPTGTGFFVSPDGWFITAAHVVVDQPSNKPRTDIKQGWLKKESPPGGWCLGMCLNPELSFIDQETDFALLKVDFTSHAKADFLQGLKGFPFISVSSRELDEAEPVYSFGYPLSNPEIMASFPNGTVAGIDGLGPRTTSAIISAKMDRTSLTHSAGSSRIYVLDKALNFGNSGGPIVATETGHVHALCSGFQTLQMSQSHMTDTSGNSPMIIIPSLYGLALSLSNPVILNALRERNIAILAD